MVYLVFRLTLVCLLLDTQTHTPEQEVLVDRLIDTAGASGSRPPLAHLLQQQMKVQLMERTMTTSRKLVRMTYKIRHSEKKITKGKKNLRAGEHPSLLLLVHPTSEQYIRTTTVALAVAKVSTNQVLCPEEIAPALFADWITLAPPRTA